MPLPARTEDRPTPGLLRRAADYWSAPQPQDSASLPSDPFSVTWLRALGIGSGGPQEVTAGSAMGVSAVYRVVSLVAGTLATLPLRTVVTSKDGTRTPASSFLDSPGLDVYTPFEWKELVAVCLLLHGNAYAQKIFNRNGALMGLDLIQPTAVKVSKNADLPGGRNYCIKLDDGSKTDLDSRNIVHIPGLSLDGVKGLSPIALARMGIASAQAADKATYQRFNSGAMLSGLVTPEDDDMEPDEATAVKETVNSSMLGPENAGGIAVVNRRLKFTPWIMTNVDAQFLQSRMFQVEEIGRWFGVPPHLLGLTEKTTSWGQGIAEQNRGLARYTLQPWTTRIQERLSGLVPTSRHAEFDYSQLLAPAPEDMVALVLSQVNGGLITPNEGRGQLNLPPVDGGNDLRLPPGAGPAATPPAPAPDNGKEAPPDDGN